MHNPDQVNVRDGFLNGSVRTSAEERTQELLSVPVYCRAEEVDLYCSFSYLRESDLFVSEMSLKRSVEKLSTRLSVLLYFQQQ